MSDVEALQKRCEELEAALRTVRVLVVRMAQKAMTASCQSRSAIDAADDARNTIDVTLDRGVV